MFANQYIVQANAEAGIENGLLDHLSPAPESYSQSGEDVIIEGLLRASFQLEGRAMNSMLYVEIGANHPISTSNTYLFYKKYEASGVLVDANPYLIESLKSVRPRDIVVYSAISTSDVETIDLHIGKASELSSLNPAHIESFGDIAGQGGIVGAVTVPNLHINDFMSRLMGRHIDLLTIDCEGLDLELLAALDFQKYMPTIIQCEPSNHFYPGNTDQMISLLHARSYRLVATTRVNLIFMRMQPRAPVSPERP